MYNFIVDGSAGKYPYQALSQEWAMIWYKVVHGLDETINSVEWVR